MSEITVHEHWQRVWTSKDFDAVSWFQPEPTPSLALLDALGVQPGDALVDIGGGASLLVDRLLAKGFSDLTVLDVTDAALAVARARLGADAARVTWVESDVRSWAPSRPRQVWHDRAVLHFLTTDEDQAAYRRVLESALAPGGLALLATFAPDGPERCSNLPVQRHDTASLARVVGPRFALVEERREEHRTPSGNVQRFQWAAFRRSAG